MHPPWLLYPPTNSEQLQCSIQWSISSGLYQHLSYDNIQLENRWVLCTTTYRLLRAAFSALQNLHSAAIKYSTLSSSVRGRWMTYGALIPLRDLWSSQARSSPRPQYRSWWGPRERPGTGSGHCMSSLDTRSRQKSVSDDGLEAEVGSGAAYTHGFSYFGGSACNIPTSLRSQRHISCLTGIRTLMASAVCYVRMFSELPGP